MSGARLREKLKALGEEALAAWRGDVLEDLRRELAPFELRSCWEDGIQDEVHDVVLGFFEQRFGRQPVQVRLDWDDPRAVTIRINGRPRSLRLAFRMEAQH